jgi:streptogramin lyase
MNGRSSVRWLGVLALLLGCSSKRDLGNLPDGGAGGTGGAAGAGGSSADATGDGGAGGDDGGAGGGMGGGAGGAGGAVGGGAGGSAGATPACDLSKPFGAPTVVPNVNSPMDDYGAELADDLTLYFGSNRPGGAGGADLYVVTRSSPQSPFATPQQLGGVNTAGTELWPRLTHDELTLFYAQYVGSGGGDLFMTTRSSVAAAFGPGVALAQVNRPDSDEGDPFLWRDGEALYFVSSRPGTAGPYDIYVSMRRADGSYDTPQAVSEVNSTGWESNPVLTPDGLRIYWSSDRTDGGGTSRDIWTATRASTSDPFGNLARVPELNSDYAESPNWISPDGCKIYFMSTRPGGPGGQDIWEATRPPIMTGTTEYPVPTASSEPVAIVAGPDGNLWFTEYSVGKIGRITPAGTITEFATGVTKEVSGITVGPDGNLWFTESGADKIGRITVAGGVAEFPLPSSGSFPEQIAAGPDGNLWFTERHNGRIGRITPSGVVAEFSIPTASSEPVGIVAGPDGNLWFNEFSGNKVGRITTAGVITEFVAAGSPSLITVGPDANLWFTEEGGEKIARITTSGSIVEYPVPTAMAGPQGITAGPDGNIWFTEEGGNKIGRVTPAGAFTEFVVPSAGAYPVHIVTGPDGALWFTEEFGNRIGRLVP